MLAMALPPGKSVQCANAFPVSAVLCRSFALRRHGHRAVLRWRRTRRRTAPHSYRTQPWDDHAGMRGAEQQRGGRTWSEQRRADVVFQAWMWALRCLEQTSLWAYGALSPYGVTLSQAHYVVKAAGVLLAFALLRFVLTALWNLLFVALLAYFAYIFVQNRSGDLGNRGFDIDAQSQYFGEPGISRNRNRAASGSQDVVDVWFEQSDDSQPKKESR